MQIFDQHVHSHHSVDCQADPAACVETAIARGLAGLTFTEHFDTNPNEWDSCIYDDEAYTTTVRELRNRFGDRIFIGKGIEVCFQPERMEFVLDFLEAREFDVVLLSVHYFGDQTVHERHHWDGLSPADGTRRYLEKVLEAGRFCEQLRPARGRVFDVLGHLDLVKRYTQRFFGTYDISSFSGLVDEILQACLAADLTPEINTSTLRQDLDEPMPGDETLARYAELGGRAMSVASDAHLAEAVGADLDRAVAMLRGAGLHHTVVFKNRQRFEVPLDEMAVKENE